LSKAVESAIRVYLLIENRLLREGISYLFRKRSDLQIVGQTDHSESLPDDLDALCDVLALDSFDPTRPIRPRAGDNLVPRRSKKVLIGMEEDCEQFLQAVRAGVSGYMLKDASASDIVAAIRATSKGEVVCPPRLCALVFERFAQTARTAKQEAAATRRANVTLRQRELANLVADRLTNREIAAKLDISEFTVRNRNHIHRILKHVHVGSRRAAVQAVRAHQ
jgi:DNA-binding NarL/FixJ family response regulator